VEGNRSVIWGGATIGLVIGLILGFFVGTYWMTVLYAVGIGAALSVVANILGWLIGLAVRAVHARGVVVEAVRALVTRAPRGVVALPIRDRPHGLWS
jgi:hypothetical protein